MSHTLLTPKVIKKESIKVYYEPHFIIEGNKVRPVITVMPVNTLLTDDIRNDIISCGLKQYNINTFFESEFDFNLPIFLKKFRKLGYKPTRVTGMVTDALNWPDSLNYIYGVRGNYIDTIKEQTVAVQIYDHNKKLYAICSDDRPNTISNSKNIIICDTDIALHWQYLSWETLRNKFLKKYPNYSIKNIVSSNRWITRVIIVK